MQSDERIEIVVKDSKIIGHTILKWGILAAILYRSFILGETLNELLYLILIWTAACLIEFIIRAFRGVPISYPVDLQKSHQLVFIFVASFISAFIPIIVLLISKSLEGFSHALEIYSKAYLLQFILFSAYRVVVYLWEKRNID